MTNELVESIVAFFQSKIPNELTVFIISVLPILELRGGLIAARLLNMDVMKAFIICYLGNMLPIPFILLFLKKIFELMKKFKGLGKLSTKWRKKPKVRQK